MDGESPRVYVFSAALAPATGWSGIPEVGLNRDTIKTFSLVVQPFTDIVIDSSL